MRKFYLITGIIVALIGAYFLFGSNIASQAKDSVNESENQVPDTTEALLPEESPPALAEAQYSTDFSKHSIPYSEILSGGPPKDGIPAIDKPVFIDVEEADDWLHPQEAVIVLQIEEQARAYPVQILMYHEIVNDTVGDFGVSVTYCPLCNTAIAFERTFDGQFLDFGTTGYLRYSNLVMYDRQTETWWQQATGEGIVGKYTGEKLAFVPVSILSWVDFQAAYPDGKVLSRETGYSRSYGRNPYTGYDNVNSTPFLYVGPETPDLLPAMTHVITIDLEDEAVAYPFPVLGQVHVVNDSVGGVPVVVFWEPGTASPLDQGSVSGGDAIGSAATYSSELDGEILTFTYEDGLIQDEQTGSTWNILGRAEDGPLAGKQLEPVVSINHFWFSWVAFRPETRVFQIENVTANESSAPDELVPGNAVFDDSKLLADFEIRVYQGEEILGGEVIWLSDIFKSGKPVVLNIWAGLCPFCRMEMPDLQELHEEYGDQVMVVGIDIGQHIGLGSEADALALLDELGITFPNGTTNDISALREYKVFGTPATYFFKSDGDLLQQWNGVLSKTQLLDYVEDLL